VTHDLDEAVRLGDRLAVLLDGRIRQCDTPDRVLTDPADADVAAFVGLEARIRGRVVAAADGLVVLDVGTRRGADRDAAAEALLRAARPVPGQEPERGGEGATTDPTGPSGSGSSESGPSGRGSARP
jgi:ABC-type sulfate/molybdate transport systems ATPase subunit